MGTAGANSAAYYGTFDQGGNVIEWNESVHFTNCRGARGGSYGNGLDDMAANNLGLNAPANEVAGVGFRLASIAVACDFDNDTACNLADVNLLFAQGDLTAGVNVAAGNLFDSNGDRRIDGSEIEAWLESAAVKHGYGSAYLRGDTDGLETISPATRDIDITDFNVLATNFDPMAANAASNTWDHGNFDGDDDIDITDFNSLAVNFSPIAYSGTSTVPEPDSLVWLLLGTVWLIRSRHAGKF